MIRKALIIEDGPARRDGLIPKGAWPVGGLSLAERSIQNLLAAGMEEVLILAGTGTDWYAELAGKYADVRLLTAEEGLLDLPGDVLVQFSDLIYEAAVLTVLRNEARPEVQLVSESGEAAGICRLGGGTVKAALGAMETAEQARAVLSETAARAPVRRNGALLWRRIRNENDLNEVESGLWPKIKESEDLRRVRREVLLNPGPATTSDSVKYAQICADICPREEEFGEVMEWICNELSLMAGRPGQVETVIFGGSGTAADEVMLSSCVPDEARLLVIDNGAYGARLAKIASVYKLKFEVYKSSGFLPLDLDAVKARLVDGGFTHLAVVYHETTTGLLNPAPEICRFCHERGITTIVDAVSAFAAIPIDMDREAFDFMASTSNKNIQGMAGVGFVFCRQEALEKIAVYPPRNYYLNLWDQYTHFKKNRQTRFTPPVQALYALRQAILETRREGIENRYARYSSCWDVLVKAVKKIGLSMLVPEAAQSKLITAILDPPSPNYSFESLHDLARSRGFTIYPGKLSEADTFRIANIGDIRPEEMGVFTELLENYMNSL